MRSEAFCFDNERKFLHVTWELSQHQRLHLENATNLILLFHPTSCFSFDLFQNWRAIMMLPFEAGYIVFEIRTFDLFF